MFMCCMIFHLCSVCVAPMSCMITCRGANTPGRLNTIQLGANRPGGPTALARWTLAMWESAHKFADLKLINLHTENRTGRRKFPANGEMHLHLSRGYFVHFQFLARILHRIIKKYKKILILWDSPQHGMKIV